MVRILGVSASLRNARYGRGSTELCADIRGLQTPEDVRRYLAEQVRIRVADFMEAGRLAGSPFDEIYRNLQKTRADRGLSNSEAALTAGLWGAQQAGAEIEHLGLSAHFPATGERRALDVLRERVLSADAILLAGPVYFGDRGSLAQEFLEFLREDAACAAHVRGRLYAGISVGAKRNGGQETTLIYQLVDTTNLNMLAVGNDDETTSQYGGTAVAGDVGTMDTDAYGIATSIGTGRRLGRVGALLAAADSAPPPARVRISIWLLQDDARHTGRRRIETLCEAVQREATGVEFVLMDFTQSEVHRCIACDICPKTVGAREEYRCIIARETDLFASRHGELVDADALLLAAYSPVNRQDIRTVYQRVIERTRYLRRDDYVFADLLAAPLVISEVGSNQNLHIRMLTSLIRQHTVLHHPLIAVEHQGEILNAGAFHQQALSFATQARRLTAGRAAVSGREYRYNPMGYVISARKADEDRTLGRSRKAEDASTPVK